MKQLDQAPTAAPPAPAADAPADRPEKQVTVAPTRAIEGRTCPLYRAVLLEIERRRLQLNISMDALTDLAGGNSERYYPKILYADGPNGREARWGMVQDYVTALYPTGFDLRISATNNGCLSAPKHIKEKVRSSAALYDRRLQRELMRELSKAAAEGRKKKIPWRKRVVLAKKAGKMRQRSLTAEQKCALAHRGALARNGKLTAEQRKQSARRAALARWARTNGEA